MAPWNDINPGFKNALKTMRNIKIQFMNMAACYLWDL